MGRLGLGIVVFFFGAACVSDAKGSWDGDEFEKRGHSKKCSLFHEIIHNKSPGYIPNLFNRITQKAHGKGDSKNPQKCRMMQELYDAPALQHRLLEKAEGFKDRFSLEKLGQILFACSVMHLHPSDDFLIYFQTKFLNVLNSGKRLSFQDFSYRFHELSRFHIPLNPLLKEKFITIFHTYLDANPQTPRDIQAVSRCLYTFALLGEIPPDDLVSRAAPIFCHNFQQGTRKTHDLAMFHLFKEWFSLHRPDFVFPSLWQDLRRHYLHNKKIKVGRQTQSMSAAQKSVSNMVAGEYGGYFPGVKNEVFVDLIGNCVDVLGKVFFYQNRYDCNANVVVEVDSFYHFFLNKPEEMLPKDILRDWILEKHGYVVKRLIVESDDLDDRERLRQKIQDLVTHIRD